MMYYGCQRDQPPEEHHMTTQQRTRQQRADYPDACEHCGEWIDYAADEHGLWAECACDAGYVA
jgi:hypothetical protein